MSRDELNKEQKVNKRKSGAKIGKRHCLGCRKSFLSEGAHHRICDNCKTLQRWMTGNPSFCSHRPDAANDNG